MSITGPSARSGSSRRSPSSGSPSQIASTTTNDWPRTGSGISGIGGNWRIRPTEVISSGRSSVQARHDLQHLGRRARPGTRGCRRRPRSIGKRLNSIAVTIAERAAAAAKRPEQVGLVRPVGADEVARRGDDLDRRHLVGADAVLAGEPGEAAAERVADDADVGRGAGERGEAVLGGRLDDLDPDHARLGARDPRVRVDRDAAHPLGLEQDRVRRGRPARRRRGRCPAARREGRSARAKATTAATSSADSGSATAAGRWSTREVPGLASLVPVVVAGADDVAVEPVAQRRRSRPSWMTFVDVRISVIRGHLRCAVH